MMHLVPELDSKAERLSDRFQLGRFTDWETERKRERVTEHSSPSELLCSSISL